MLKRNLYLFIILISFYCCSQVKSNLEIRGISFEAPSTDVSINTFEPLSQIGANYIALMPYAFARKGETNLHYNINRQWVGEREEGIVQAIVSARHHNLNIMMKPHLWIQGSFTGDMTFDNEEDWKAWEQSYTSYILFYAKLASKYNVELFCIGTELKAFVKERPDYWYTLITKVREVYKGKLIYAANWDNYQFIPFWTAIDFIGVDAYFPLNDSKTPKIEDLKQGWKPWWNQLETISNKNNRSVVFTEIGYRSIDYCVKKPWMSYENFGYENQEAQANALQAFFETSMNKTFFKGAFLWKWHAKSHLPSDGNKKYTFQAKKAMDVVLKYY